ncbi:MAG: hypothetical protein ACJ75F_10865 [Flavisolibacter sp.]|jgi:hypothetical protein
MKNYDRDLLVLYKADVYNDDLLQREVESLHRILLQVECHDIFCSAHELVKRNSITSKTKSILKAISSLKLKPFFFLINKN